MCKLVKENADRKAIILELGEKKYAITKECMPKEEFEKIFPDETFVRWDHIQRSNIIKNRDVFNLVKKKRIGTINCNVRMLN